MADEANAWVPLSRFAAQGEVYDGLMHSLRSGTLPHALLITGMSGVGKRTLARAVTMYLLCQGAEKPCGVCPACRQVLSGNHPDALVLQPGRSLDGKSAGESATQTIRVDEIRELNRRAAVHSYEGGPLVFRVEAAGGRMNAAAQNALLKTLEEPRPGVYILLIEESPRMLLSTVVSRCRQLSLHAWPDTYVRTVLTEHGLTEGLAEAVTESEGAIGRALAIAQDTQYQERVRRVRADFFGLTSRSDIPGVAKRWAEGGVEGAAEGGKKTASKVDRRRAGEQLLDILDNQLRLLILVRCGQLPAQSADALPPPWPRAAREAPLRSLVALTDQISGARRLRESNVTWQAVLEQVLFAIMEEKNKWLKS